MAAAWPTTWGRRSLPPASRGSNIAFGRDWNPAARLQNATSWHYMNTDQWRYERDFTDYHTVRRNGNPRKARLPRPTIDIQARAVRSGWMPGTIRNSTASPLDVVARGGARRRDDRRPDRQSVVGDLAAGR